MRNHKPKALRDRARVEFAVHSPWSAVCQCQAFRAGQAQVYYIYSDQLNTPRVITDANNNIVWRNLPTTDPFGNSPVEDDPSNTGHHSQFNIRGQGQYADTESNLVHNGFRDLDTLSGRFIQAEPIGLAGGSYSLYALVNNEPLRRVDPRGLANFLFGGGGSAVVGGGGEGSLGLYISISRAGLDIGVFDSGGAGGGVTLAYLATALTFLVAERIPPERQSIRTSRQLSLALLIWQT